MKAPPYIQTISALNKVNYANGETIRSGSVISIDGMYCGQVVAAMDTSDYLPGFEDWAHLGEGIMVKS